MTRLGTTKAPRGAFLLATCLRLEIMVAGDADDLDRVLAETFGDAPPGRRLAGPAAVRHLMRVAAGLESPLVGELEIWTQFRQAVVAAKEAGIHGRCLRLLEEAVAAGRRARSLLPSTPHGSLASTAARCVEGSEAVAVLGAGAMGKAVVEALDRTTVARVVVVARDPGKTRSAGEVWGFDRAEEALVAFPAVISATSAKRRLVPAQRLARLLASRDTPLLLVDLGMPPDFDVPVGAPVEYVAIDQLAGMASHRVDATAAERHTDEAAARAWHRYQERNGPTITALYSAADAVVERTVARFAGRLADPGDVAVLRQTAHTVARTLLAAPVARLHRPERSAEIAAVLADAFDLEP